MAVWNFNPIIVRFKQVDGITTKAGVNVFQSYNSSIQTMDLFRVQLHHHHFNPIIVRFKLQLLP